MAGDLVAVADGRGSLFATLDADGIVTVWSGHETVRSQFEAEIARVSAPTPSDRLAIVVDAEETSVVVGSGPAA